MHVERLVGMSLCALLCAAAASAQTPEVRLRPVRVGDQSVSGFVLPEPAAPTGFVIEVYDISNGGHRFVDRRTIDRFERGGGFSVPLGSPATGNQRYEVSRDGVVLNGGTVDVPAPPGPRPAAATLSPIRPGQQAVTGIIVPAPKSAEGLYVEVMGGMGFTDFVERKALERVDAATGAFSVTLAAPVRTNQRVSIGPAAQVTVTPIQTGLLPTKPTILTRLLDGGRIVRGNMADVTGVGSIRVKVLRSALEHQGRPDDYLQMKAVGVSEVGAAGEFLVTLDAPLVAGQIVIAEAVTTGREVGPRSDSVTVTDPGNWGRARAYFAGGVVFSKEREDFSKQDLALSFVIDKGWLQKPDFQLGAERAPSTTLALTKARSDRDACEAVAESGATKSACRAAFDTAVKPFQSNGRFSFRQLNTFFDARLTSLPVISPAPATTSSTPATSSTPSTATTATTPAFVDSRKGALMQIGAYAPIYGPQTSWVHEGAVNALFIAPVFRYGIQTITSKGDGAPTVNAEGKPDDIFNFWGFGFGLGHQRLSGSTNQTPEVISYLHVVIGKAEAFRRAEANGAIRNKTRAMVEGRLKIPDTAFQVGFDANLGDGHDDIRFVFGTRFDIGQLFGRLRNFQP